SRAAAAQNDGIPGTSAVGYPARASLLCTYIQVEYTVGSPRVRNTIFLPSSKSSAAAEASLSWISFRTALSLIIGIGRKSFGFDASSGTARSAIWYAAHFSR